MKICIDRTTKRSLSGKTSYPAVTLTIKPGPSKDEEAQVKHLLFNNRKYKSNARIPEQMQRDVTTEKYNSGGEEELMIQNVLKTPRLTVNHLKVMMKVCVSS